VKERDANAPATRGNIWLQGMPEVDALLDLVDPTGDPTRGAARLCEGVHRVLQAQHREHAKVRRTPSPPNHQTARRVAPPAPPIAH